MTPQEWLVVAVFAATVYGIGLVSPSAALLLGGMVAIAAFARGDIGNRVLNGIRSVGKVA